MKSSLFRYVLVVGIILKARIKGAAARGFRRWLQGDSEQTEFADNPLA